MLYTIGYTAFKLSDFIEVLRFYGINVVIDVRSNPYSEHYSEYNKENIKYLLDSHEIFYRNYQKEFGARQTEKKFFSKEGYLDFELFTKSVNFKLGYDKIANSLAKKYNVVLMCAEKDPAICHRAIMISQLQRRGLSC